MSRSRTQSGSDRAAGTSLPPAVVLGLAAWFGLLSGAANVGLRSVQLAAGHKIHLGAQFVWMAPLADVVLFTAAGILVVLAGRAWSRCGSASCVLFGFMLLLLLGPLLFAPRLHRGAGLLLALGLAAQGARLLRSRLSLVVPLARRTTPVLVGAFLLLGIGLNVHRSIGEKRFFAGLPDARPGAPNVLLIILDTVRASNLSLYGYDRATTPNLSEFARSGVVFERAIAPSPWTLPSHASIFTGRYPHEVSADWLSPLDDRHPTLAEWLAARGYATAGFVANLLYATGEDGLARGFGTYQDYPVSVGMVLRSSLLARVATRTAARITGSDEPLVRLDAGRISSRFLRWLDGRDEDLRARPFFAFLNYFDAHLPYQPPPPFDLEFGPRRFEREVSMREGWTPEELQVQIDGYDGALAYLDDELGRLFAELEHRGLLEGTLVIVTSDHGEHLGEHGLTSHGNSLYRPLVHVPLVLRFDGRLPAGRRIGEPVTLADLPATVAELVAADHGSAFPGRSLSVHWAAGAGAAEAPRPVLSQVSRMINRPEHLPAARGDMKAIIANGLHYIQNSNGEEELYDFDADPDELENLLSSPAARAGYLELRELLESILARGAAGGSAR